MLTYLSLSHDLADYDLKNISEICASLFYLNLRGCITVTDTGISVLILRCVKLHSLVVCDTSFGHNSALALRSGIPNLNDFPTLHVGKNHAKSLASEFQVLHVGGCHGKSFFIHIPFIFLTFDSRRLGFFFILGPFKCAFAHLCVFSFALSFTF